MTAVDFEKTFDTVSWVAMRKVMRKFGFSERFIKLTIMCYKNFMLNIDNNGYSTPGIKVQLGNKQGAHCLPYNFC